MAVTFSQFQMKLHWILKFWNKKAQFNTHKMTLLSSLGTQMETISIILQKFHMMVKIQTKQLKKMLKNNKISKKPKNISLAVAYQCTVGWYVEYS